MKYALIALALMLGSATAMAADCKEGTVLDEKSGECVPVASGDEKK